MRLSSRDVVIGIDGGGSHTRAIVSDLNGNVLSYVETGAASIRKDLQARLHVQEAITSAIKDAGVALSQVRAIASGIAGHESDTDLEWITPLTDIEGLNCSKWHYNDAIAALYSAFLTKPGIIAISGTGSVVAAMTEEGQFIRNVQFDHYASSAARYIVYPAVHEVLAGYADATDMKLIDQMLHHWDVSSVEQLYQLGLQQFNEDHRVRDQHFGKFAPCITEAATEGSAIARRICNSAVYQLRVGIELMGRSFSAEKVSLAYIGSVMNSKYFKAELTRQLQTDGRKRYELVENHLTPVAGSVLYALKQLGVEGSKSVVHNLKQYENEHC